MGGADTLDAGREAYARQDWAGCYARLAAADPATLPAEDLERLGTAAYLIGREVESVAALARAYRVLVDDGAVERAARNAFWLAFQLLNRGDVAQGGGWLARAHRLLDEGRHDCVEQGYLIVPAAHQAILTGDPGAAVAECERAIGIGERFQDPTLTAIARLGLAQASLELGEYRRATVLLDEVMVSVTSGEVAPIIAGIAYCAVIIACQESFDLRRAHEWTTALGRWCESQPDLVPYRGQCLVHRAEIMQLHGDWSDAMAEAERARERLSDPAGQPAVGMALYLQGELHRLRGESGAAEDAYRRANQWGREPQPGLALLRLAQGRFRPAESGIRRAVEEARDPFARARLLPAYVEVLLAAGDHRGARAATDDLAGIAERADVPYLRAVAAAAAGAVFLAEGNGADALEALRRAWTGWQQVDAPYEAARTRVLIGLACRAVGDEGSAEMELDAARWVFQQLGAMPDLARIADLWRGREAGPACGLTPRELEVLRLVAAGQTNRGVAVGLVISEKTVARHLSNIFTKLDLSSRSAATAYAYEHGLV